MLERVPQKKGQENEWSLEWKKSGFFRHVRELKIQRKKSRQCFTYKKR